MTRRTGARSQMTRCALLVTHIGRRDIVEMARQVVHGLTDADFEVRLLASEAGELGVEGVRVVPADDLAAQGAEIALVLGGDGTFLRAAELARPAGAPLLGVNLGRVGFLAETEPDALPETIKHIVRREYTVEHRLTVDVRVTCGGQLIGTSWALNEASVEKASRERMLEVTLLVDDHPLTAFGCDGV